MLGSGVPTSPSNRQTRQPWLEDQGHFGHLCLLLNISNFTHFWGRPKGPIQGEQSLFISEVFLVTIVAVTCDCGPRTSGNEWEEEVIICKVVVVGVNERTKRCPWSPYMQLDLVRIAAHHPCTPKDSCRDHCAVCTMCTKERCNTPKNSWIRAKCTEELLPIVYSECINF